MIPVLLSLLTAQASSQGSFGTTQEPKPVPAPTATQARVESARIKAFVQAVETDRNGRRVSSPGEDPEPRFIPSENPLGWRPYDCQGFGIAIDPATGYVVGFNGRADHRPERPKRPAVDDQGRPTLVRALREVSDDEAKAIAARAYAATGHPYGILASTPLVNTVFTGEPDDLAVRFRPTCGGVPFGPRFFGYFQIDKETGEVDGMRIFREPPAPPVSVVPGVSADDARWVALRAAALAGVAVREQPTPWNRLSIDLLHARPYGGSSYGFTPADHDDAVAGRARLVYDVRLVGTRDGATYTVLVDAHDGHLLQVTREAQGTQGGVGKPKPAEPLALPASAQAWRVAEGDAPWGKPVIATLTPVPADGFAPGRKILLTDGHLAFTASYDPASERIGVENTDKSYTTYRPGPALAELLRRSKG